jgi:hypothetical protein
MKPEAGKWLHGTLPENVALGPNTVITGDLAFKRFHTRVPNALRDGWSAF